MATEAQRRATARYDRENTRQFKLKLNRRTDRAVIERLDAQPNVQGYIRRLVVEDMCAEAEDGLMEQAIAADMEAGDMRVAFDGSTATFVGATESVGRWLVRRLDARRDGDTLSVAVGEDELVDRVAVPMLGRLLGDRAG